LSGDLTDRTVGSQPPLPVPTGLIFVNCGDFMSIVSQGKFVSPLHRVISPEMVGNSKDDDSNHNDNITRNVNHNSLAQNADNGKSNVGDKTSDKSQTTAVQNPAKPEKPPDRTSCVFFYYPKYDATVPTGTPTATPTGTPTCTPTASAQPSEAIATSDATFLVALAEQEFIAECGSEATQRFRRKNQAYSLFQDQKREAGESYRGGAASGGSRLSSGSSSSSGNICAPEAALAESSRPLCFGEFLSKKWEQVARNK
jgi:hypothetical protein